MPHDLASRLRTVALVLAAAFVAFRVAQGLRSSGGEGVSGGDPGFGVTGAAECAPGTPGCTGPAGGRTPGPTILGPDACGSGGYLCAALRERDTLRIVRFGADVELLTVRVARPDVADPARARRLQRAAIRGLQAWQGHPFPIRIEERNRGEPVDMEIHWVRSLEGSALGRTRSRFASGPRGVEYRVVNLTLVTRIPGDESRALDPTTVELTAAHEMGHALGLPHSDDRRDLMYPRNTATHPTPRDYRTVENLYELPNGALLVAERRRDGPS